MSEYEIMLLTRTDLEEAERTLVIDRAKEAVSGHGGKWIKLDDWGRRRTAYPIDKLNEAHYQVIEFDGSGETVDEAVRVLRITEGVMRVIATTRVPEYPEGAREKLERITDEEFEAGSKDRGRGRGGRSSRSRD